MNARNPVLTIPAVALLPLILYALLGYSGQDFPFHLTSWLSIRESWLSGQLFPIWASAANFNLGDPHLGFYPPISLYLGGFLTLILPIQIVPAAFAWLTLTLAGITMYHAAKTFLAPDDRLPAAILYLLNPYLISTLFIRFAAGELIVQAFLPLILLYLYQSVTNPTRRAVLQLAALLGLTWLTNIPASIVLLYTFLAFAAIRSIQHRSPAPLLRLVLAETTAAALAAFYLVPVWFERHYIQQKSLLFADPRQFLLFMRPPPYPFSVLIVSFWIIALTAITIIALSLRNQSTRSAANNATQTWAILSAMAFFFQLPLALPLWQLLPQLNAVQFSFRFLSITGATLPLLLFSPTTARSLRRPATVTLALLLIMPSLIYLSMRIGSTEPHLAPLAREWRQGYKSAPEYLPIQATPQRTAPNLPAITTADPTCTAAIQHQTPTTRLIATTSAQPCAVTLPVSFYPYWQAADESHHQLTTSPDPAGLLLLQIPPGTHITQLTFRASSLPRTISLILSALALILVTTLLLQPGPRSNPAAPGNYFSRKT